MGFLGAMQVLGTEAQSDSDLLRELSTDLAEASAPGSPFLPDSPIASKQSSEVSPLTSQTAPFAETLTEPGVTVQPLEAPATEPAPESPAAAESPTPEPTPEATATPESMKGCAPALSGGPYCIYTVQDGDTLSQIAAALGMESTVAFSGAELLALSNGLNDAQNWVIVPGQQLRVPIDSGVIHTVSASDSLSRLAEIYGVTTADIVAANGFSDPDHVPVGNEIIIPSPTLWPWNGPVAAVAIAEEPEPTEEATEAASEEAEAEATEPPAEADTATALADTPAPEPTPTDEPEPTAAPAASQPRSTSSANSNPTVATVREQFAAGYVAGGGPARHLEHILQSVIACESGYNVRAYNPAGPFYGLMQFLPQTWANTGGGDWFDAWQQGHNTAVLLQSSTPQSQWPHCWHAG